uniref:Plasmid pRiA4b Orf3-like domain-containing protein n=1 Tax=Xanthomonas citri pv. phaseoli var. fuscans TaxID=473423 RepID=A0A808FMU4_XANCI
MDAADPRLEGCAEPLYDPVRGATSSAVTQTTVTQNSAHALVAGKYACPPEDCGGSWGYADLLRVLAGHRNARRRELIEWLGGPFDPKVFDMDEAQKRLSEYVEVSMPKNHQPTA